MSCVMFFILCVSARLVNKNARHTTLKIRIRRIQIERTAFDLAFWQIILQTELQRLLFDAMKEVTLRHFLNLYAFKLDTCK